MPLFMFCINQTFAYYFPLKWIYFEIAFYTEYVVLSYYIDTALVYSFGICVIETPIYKAND